MRNRAAKLRFIDKALRKSDSCAFPVELKDQMFQDPSYCPVNDADIELVEQLIRFVSRCSDCEEVSSVTIYDPNTKNTSPFDTNSTRVLTWLLDAHKENFAIPGGNQVVEYFLDRINR